MTNIGIKQGIAPISIKIPHDMEIKIHLGGTRPGGSEKIYYGSFEYDNVDFIVSEISEKVWEFEVYDGDNHTTLCWFHARVDKSKTSDRAIVYPDIRTAYIRPIELDFNAEDMWSHWKIWQHCALIETRIAEGDRAWKEKLKKEREEEKKLWEEEDYEDDSYNIFDPLNPDFTGD